MVAKWRVHLRVDLDSALLEAATRGVHACLDAKDDGSGTVRLRVEGAVTEVMKLSDLWDVLPHDVVAFWY